MSKLKKSAIKEIAHEVSLGRTCYVHRYTAEITSIDLDITDPTLVEKQQKIIIEIERKINDYVKINKLKNQEQIVIMKDFLEEIPDKSVRKELSNALNRKNPIRNFMQTIESDIILTQHWKNYRVEEYQRLVSNLIIDAYNY